jgi:hypothetical protein
MEPARNGREFRWVNFACPCLGLHSSCSKRQFVVFSGFPFAMVALRHFVAFCDVNQASVANPVKTIALDSLIGSCNP